MTDPVLRIFSYLPNPRVWKALFAARLCGLEVEVCGDKPGELGNWLWDLAPRPLEPQERDPSSPHARQSRRGFGGVLYKTDAFLQRHPFGTVPAAFSPDGEIGIFESNSILRAVARNAPKAGLYGQDPYDASRIDSFLDANLVFAREAQVYLLALQGGSADATLRARMDGAYEFYLSGVETALAHSTNLAGEIFSIADISFACDLAQFLREGHYVQALDALGLELISKDAESRFPRCFEHLSTIAGRAEFEELHRYLRWYRERDQSSGTS